MLNEHRAKNALVKIIKSDNHERGVLTVHVHNVEGMVQDGNANAGGFYEIELVSRSPVTI